MGGPENGQSITEADWVLKPVGRSICDLSDRPLFINMLSMCAPDIAQMYGQSASGLEIHATLGIRHRTKTNRTKWDEARCSPKLSSSCFLSNTHRVTRKKSDTKDK